MMISMNDGLVPQALALSLNKKWKTAEYRFYWKSNVNHPSFAHWHRDIVPGDLNNKSDLSPCLLKFVDESEVWERLQSQVLGPSDLFRCYVNAYTFGTEGAPHTDSNIAGEQTTIIYLNETWKAIWAGETVVFNANLDDIIGVAMPKLGRMFSFPADMFHAARPVSKSCPELRMVLVYKSKPKSTLILNEKEKLLLTWLEKAGTKTTPHRNKTLYDHLLGTHQILKKENAPEELCLAGLFHSIYGTDIFKHATTMQRDDIRSLIGHEAEVLVYIFSILKRPECWKYPDNAPWPQTDGNFYMVYPKTAELLRWLEKANLAEQNPPK